jgi:TetR/AcrR family transcriptional regulator, mexCD-oprJ operon repressor
MPSHGGASLTRIRKKVNETVSLFATVRAVVTSSRRPDAARNDERIITGAMAELSRDPAARMESIAAACGVSRATIFRRYANRDEVLAAVRARAHSDLDAAVEAAALEEGSAVEALERLVAGLLEVSLPYAFLLQHPASPTGRPKRLRHVSEQIEALIGRGQASGEFRNNAPPSWWVEVIVAVLQAATQRASSGPPADAATLMRATLVYGLRGNP